VKTVQLLRNGGRGSGFRVCLWGVGANVGKRGGVVDGAVVDGVEDGGWASSQVRPSVAGEPRFSVLKCEKVSA
jgi:hypothetical protein